LIEDIYEDIIDKIRKILKEKTQLSIKELITTYLTNYEYENIIALIKFLLSSNILVLKNPNSENDLETSIVQWNEVKKDLKIPKRKFPEFNTIRLCVTFPPFDTSGLLIQLKKHHININSLLNEFSSLFSKAKTSIKISSPFLEYNGFEYFKDILIQKAKLKVKLQILSRQIKINEKNSRYNDIKRIYECFSKEKLENFIDIRNYYYQSKNHILMSSIHAKIILIDDNIAYIGSGEIRKNCFEKNLEVGVILTGSKVTELVLIYDKLFSKSEVMEFS